MERVSRSKAIRLKCLDCCAGQAAEVRRCPAKLCPLWRFRMGREVKDDCNEKIVNDTSEEIYEFYDDFEDEDVKTTTYTPTILII